MLVDGADENVDGMAINVNNRVVGSTEALFQIAASFQANMESGLRYYFSDVTVHVSLTQLGTAPADLSDNAILLMLIRLPSYNACVEYMVGSHGLVAPVKAYPLINGAY